MSASTSATSWITIVAAVITGLALVTVAIINAWPQKAITRLQHKQQHQTEERTRRRALIAQGRALVDEGTRKQWSPPRVARDSRYRELRPYLPVGVQETYNQDSDML